MPQLLIPSCLLNKVIAEATSSTCECCGFLLGEINGDAFRVRRTSGATNVLRSPSRFRMAKRDVARAYRIAQKLNLEFVGIYHSHPGEPLPSPLDLEGMAAWKIPWLIVDSLSGRCGAFLLDEGRLLRLKLIVLDGGR